MRSLCKAVRDDRFECIGAALAVDDERDLAKVKLEVVVAPGEPPALDEGLGKCKMPAAESGGHTGAVRVRPLEPIRIRFETFDPMEVARPVPVGESSPHC